MAELMMSAHPGEEKWPRSRRTGADKLRENLLGQVVFPTLLFYAHPASSGLEVTLRCHKNTRSEAISDE
jgi:hypothetical protein